jgi:hypothetical protein
MLSAIMLLKMKLLVDLVNIKIARKVAATRLPPELWPKIEFSIIRSSLSHPWIGKSYQAIEDAQRMMQIHVERLAGACHDSNVHFLRVLLTAEEHMNDIPEMYSPGSFEEMLLSLQNSYPAWWQHVGVLELLRTAQAIAAKDNKDEVERLMNSATFKNLPGENPSRAQLLDSISRNSLWSYFEDAVEHASFLAEGRP